jgi:ribosome-binding protein aMBF1 (putative translation factor)
MTPSSAMSLDHGSAALRRQTQISIARVGRIRSFAQKNGLSASRFACMAGLGVNSLRDMWSAAWSPTADTLRKLEAVIPKDFLPEGEEAA